jgi:hypothetical protein
MQVIATVKIAIKGTYSFGGVGIPSAICTSRVEFVSFPFKGWRTELSFDVMVSLHCRFDAIWGALYQ